MSRPGLHTLGLIALFIAATIALTGCGARTSAITEQGVRRSPVWPVASPKDEGLDMRVLAEADRRARTEFRGVASLLVARHGRLVFERYYRGVRGGDRLPVFSITKSVLSALIGIALADRSLGSVDERLVHFLPEAFGPATDARARSITLRHLLTMTAGFLRSPAIIPDDPVRDLPRTRERISATTAGRVICSRRC